MRTKRGPASPIRAALAAGLPLFLTTPEVAVLLRIPIRSVYALVDRQALRVHRVGRLLRFSVEDVRAFIDSTSEPWA